MKEKQRIYISGPISGHDLTERRNAFLGVQTRLELMGYEVANPFNNGQPQDATIYAHMRSDIEMLLACDCIYMMRRWSHSKGCLTELMVATAIGLPVIYEESHTMIKFE